MALSHTSGDVRQKKTAKCARHDNEAEFVQPLLKWNIFCVSVALSIHHAIRMRRIFICGLPRTTIIFLLILKGHNLKE